MISASKLSLPLLIATLTFGSAARATPLPASGEIHLSTNYFPVDGPAVQYSDNEQETNLTLSHNVPGGYTTATASAATSTISVNGSSALDTTGGMDTTDTDVVLNYFYDVTGTTKTVPIDISYNLSASLVHPLGTGVSIAQADFYSDDTTGVIQAEEGYKIAEVDYDDPSGDSVLAGTFSTDVTPGMTIGEIALNVKVDTSSTDMGLSSSGEAVADPYIYIDPAFLAANPGVTLEISPGVGNTPPTTSAAPEPQGWLLLLMGVGGAGLMIRRARLTELLQPLTVLGAA